MPDTDIVIRHASIEEILELRHAVLRAGLPRDTARFAGDDAGTTLHFAAEEAGHVVACASFMLNEWHSRPAWQLRGMAVDPGRRSTGIGARLLAFAEAEAQHTRPTALFWANARAPAIRFYLRHGWQKASDLFDIPTAGPHYKIVKELPPASCSDFMC